MNKTGRSGLLSIILQLGKIRISLPVALTGFLGYFRCTPNPDSGLLYTILGILFLSMGSSTFNQVQERDIDQLMNRTRNRPLPAGRIGVKEAVVIGILLSVTGFLLLLLTEKMAGALLGLFTLVWYNLVYTPLKRKTAFAVLPGAIIGALPPMIGWVTAGGELGDREIQLIAFFLFIGQMPHYWLLMIKSGEEFSGAGLPVITNLFSARQIRNINFTWIFSAAVTVVMFPALGLVQTNWVSFVLLGMIVLFLLRMFVLSFRGDLVSNWRKSFMTVNLFYLLIILLLICDQWIETYF